MSNAPQGPGWWQASDGNWYPPQQQAGYAPPPPGPPSWSAPSYPQYPAPVGQTRGVAHLPLAAWLLFLALAVELISCLLPTYTVSAGGETHNTYTFSAGGKTHDAGLTGADWVEFLVVYGVMAVLVWATFAGPRLRRGMLIALTVWASLVVIGEIGAWTFSVPASGSPAAGLFVSTASSILFVVGIVLAWTSRSKAQPRPY
jgi:hypothetical protein